MSELKNCPFCGERVLGTTSEHKHTCYFEALDRLASNLNGELTKTEIQELNDAWNTRAPAIPADLREKVLELCDIVENYTDIPLTKQLREMMGEA